MIRRILAALLLLALTRSVLAENVWGVPVSEGGTSPTLKPELLTYVPKN